MMLNKKSSSASLLKLLALLPIVGVTLALQAETVNDYVYSEKPQTQQKKVVKKGRKDGQVKASTKTIEVKEEKAEATEKKAKEETAKKQDTRENPKIVFTGANGPEPLLVINGKVATKEQVMALDQDEIDHINVVKPGETAKEYGKHFNADVSNGIVFINTKDYVKNGTKELVSVAVKAKEPQKAEPKKKPNAVVTVDAPEPDKVFDVVELMPEFPGGQAEMMKFLMQNVKYPKEAYEKGIEGRVVVSFIVEPDGSLSNIKVRKKVNDEIDAEAVRIIEAMPKWKPGKQNGKAVRVNYTIPVTFRLS